MQSDQKQFTCYEVHNGTESLIGTITTKSSKQAARTAYSVVMKRQNISMEDSIGVNVIICINDNTTNKSSSYNCSRKRLEIPNTVQISNDKSIEFNYSTVIKKVK